MTALRPIIQVAQRLQRKGFSSSGNNTHAPVLPSLERMAIGRADAFGMKGTMLQPQGLPQRGRQAYTYSIRSSLEITARNSQLTLIACLVLP